MNTKEKINHFKNLASEALKAYEIKLKSFKEGDFGDLDRIEFNNKEKGGYVDFWSKGYVNISLVDYLNSKEIINTMTTPEEENQINSNLENLIKAL